MGIDAREWARSHPYTSVAVGAAILIAIGTFFVIVRSQATPTRTPRAWGGTGSPLVNPTSYTPNAVLETLNVYTNATDTPIGFYTSGQSQTTGTDPFDYEALLASLSAPKKGSANATTSSDISLAYSFIPQGLVSIPAPTRERTDVQQKLFEYGNSAGSSIQSYEVLHRNDSQKLRDQAEDRQNVEKAETARAIARSMQDLGESLARMEDVPGEIRPNHEKLARAYITIGINLAKVPDAQGDEAFIAAIQSYNASVEAFIRSYVSVAETFSAHGVTFAQHEPGSAFVFTNTGL